MSLGYEHCYLPEVLGCIQIYCMYEHRISASCAPTTEHHSYYKITPTLLPIHNIATDINTTCKYYCAVQQMDVILNPNFNFLLLSILLFLISVLFLL